MTDRNPPRQPPPLPKRVPPLENFRPMSERADARAVRVNPSPERSCYGKFRHAERRAARKAARSLRARTGVFESVQAN